MKKLLTTAALLSLIFCGAASAATPLKLQPIQADSSYSVIDPRYPRSSGEFVIEFTPAGAPHILCVHIPRYKGTGLSCFPKAPANAR